jgi:hypothetical protein
MSKRQARMGGKLWEGGGWLVRDARLRGGERYLRGCELCCGGHFGTSEEAGGY